MNGTKKSLNAQRARAQPGPALKFRATLRADIKRGDGQDVPARLWFCRAGR